MVARRRSQSELPNAPLELLHPLLLPGADIPGADIVREIGGGDGATLLELLRAVLAWSAHPDNAPALESAALARTEYELLSRGPDPFASPAGLLAGYMANAAEATQRDVSWACVCLSDWASERGAKATALQFAQAAALAWPRHPRYAWMVARMLRAQSRFRESEAWFRRAHRVAVWSDDWEAQARTLSSLGNLNLATGKVGHAKRLHYRALRVARRFGLRGLEGEVCHDLFVVHAGSGDREKAEDFAAQAFAAYGARHHNLVSLVHDIAQLWTEQGFYWRSLPVFQALVRRSDLRYVGIREFAGASHAAGMAGERSLFASYSVEVRDRVDDVPGRVSAGALLEVGLGAECLAEFSVAADFVRDALRIAEECGAGDTIVDCEVALARIELCHQAANAIPRGRRELDHNHPGDLLAFRMATTVGVELRSEYEAA